MDTQISAASSNGNATATSSSGTDASFVGNGQPSGEANGQSATATETFIPQGLDLNTLPPHLRAHVEKINSDMVRGFTEKTTKLSETVKSQLSKELEPYKQKATSYDELVKQEEFVRRWNDYVQEVNARQSQPGPDDPQTKLAQQVEELKKSNEEIAFEVRTAKAAEVLNAFADAVDEKGAKLHPEFERLSTITIGQHEKAGDFSLLRAAIELSPGASAQEKLENGYKTAKAAYDAIFDEGRKAGMGRLQQKVQNATNPPSSIPGTQMSAGRPKDALEALQWAKKGIAVQR